jgi:hypothetical protein
MLSFFHALSVRRHISPGQFYAMPEVEQKFFVASILQELEAENAIRKKIENMKG